MGAEGELFNSETEKGLLFHVVVYNNEYNTFEEVIHIIQKAVCCSIEVAEHIAWEIHNKGKTNVMVAPFTAAKSAARIISSIGIKVTVSKASLKK